MIFNGLPSPVFSVFSFSRVGMQEPVTVQMVATVTVIEPHKIIWQDHTNAQILHKVISLKFPCLQQ